MLRLKFFKGNIYVSLFLRLLLILAIYSFCRIAFYAFNLSNFPGVTPSDLLTMLWGGVKFDISALLYINSLFILSQIIPFKFRHNVTYQKVCAWLFFITNGIALAFNIGDIAYYPFTLKRTTFQMQPSSCKLIQLPDEPQRMVIIAMVWSSVARVTTIMPSPSLRPPRNGRCSKALPVGSYL